MEIIKTNNSPRVVLDTENLFLTIEGDSFMENVSSFYERVINEFRKNAVKDLNRKFNVTILLGFYNTSSMYFINMLLTEINMNFELLLTFNVQEDDYDDFEDNISYLIATNKVQYQVNIIKRD